MIEVDGPALADLVAFAELEVASHDLEPWAELLAALPLELEARHWLVKGYNAFDDLGSAWQMTQWWPTPAWWIDERNVERIASLPCTQERRGLRGGRVARHYDSYLEALGGQTQAAWCATLLLPAPPEVAYRALVPELRRIWGVGRQTAFEWAEFLTKVLGVPIAAPDAALWDSEGPRRSLQRLYDCATPDRAWLDARASHCRDHLAGAGVALSWEDFETVICDFNVMRDGRYYPGRHLAALRAEIDALPASFADAWDSFVPEPWRAIAPGIDKAKLGRYRDTGVLVDRP